MTEKDEYAHVAADYDWLLDDDARSGETLFAAFAGLVGGLPEGAHILDCACGTGHNAVALARRGFAVWGSDASPAMITEARQTARRQGIDLPFLVCRWRDLPEYFPEPFDAVFCLGNSICHAGGNAEMVEALHAMRGVLKPGGWLALDGRNWERLRERGRHFDIPTQAVERDGMHCVCVRVWDEPGPWDSIHRLDVVFVLLDGEGHVEHHAYTLHYYPYRQAALTERLRAACFHQVEWISPEGDWLALAAR
jgi:SAM-dependent methyltransferase